MCTIYVLKCEGDKYFVGNSRNSHSFSVYYPPEMSDNQTDKQFVDINGKLYKIIFRPPFIII